MTLCGLGLAALLFASGREVQAVELNVLAAGAVESILRDMVGTFERESCSRGPRMPRRGRRSCAF